MSNQHFGKWKENAMEMLFLVTAKIIPTSLTHILMIDDTIHL
jgi:hypothetical protein